MQCMGMDANLVFVSDVLCTRFLLVSVTLAYSDLMKIKELTAINGRFIDLYTSISVLIVFEYNSCIFIYWLKVTE